MDFSSSVDNPLIAPCKCEGSLRLVHVGCLRSWVQTKVLKTVDKNIMKLNYPSVLRC